MKTTLLILPFAAQVGQTTLPTLDRGGSSTVIAPDASNGVHAAGLKFVLKRSPIFVAGQSYSGELLP